MLPPAATGNALAALVQASAIALAHDLTGPLASLQPAAMPFTLDVQRRYNPEGITEYNIVPGLMGVVLTMTMVMITGLAITRERERGTLEQLMVTPASPVAVVLGKLLPYLALAFAQLLFILLLMTVVFRVPIHGNIFLLLGLSVVYLFALQP